MSLIKKLESLTYKFYGTVVKVVDGDTVKIHIDLGFGVFTQQNIRVANINCPELSTQDGKNARDYLNLLLPTGTKVVIRTEKYRQSFTRYVGDIYLDDGQSVADIMVNAGLAVREIH
jgi:endonuclease YncB( thermonuclease family)